MTPSPILKVLSTIRNSGVQALLMGGQACVFYGAAEFSRDVDLLILINRENLTRFQTALEQLEAEVVAVPPFAVKFLRTGHAVHFRCRREDLGGLRIDVLAKLRGLGDFEELWKRRTTIQVAEETVELIGLEDLVAAKKTQRDKDWPMIRRLVEQNYFENRHQPDRGHVFFWLRELRTPELLVAVRRAWPQEASEVATTRPAVSAAIAGDEERVQACVEIEEKEERQRDRSYWEPLRRELEQLRRTARLRPEEGSK